MSLKGRPVAGTLTVILERQTALWTILLAASFLLLFAQAHDARLHGDALMYAGEARLIADSGEYATLRFGQSSITTAPCFLAHGYRHKDSRSYTVRRHLFFAAFRHGLHCSNRLAGIIFFWRKCRLAGGHRACDLLHLPAQHQYSADGFCAYLWRSARYDGLLPR